LDIKGSRDIKKVIFTQLLIDKNSDLIYYYSEDTAHSERNKLLTMISEINIIIYLKINKKSYKLELVEKSSDNRSRNYTF